MEELSTHAQTTLSYLKDVEQAGERLESIDNHLLRERAGLALINGDLRLASSELIAAESGELRFLRGLCSFREGTIYCSIASGYSKFSMLSEQQTAQYDYLARAAEAFAGAIAADPSPCTTITLVPFTRRWTAKPRLSRCSR